MVDVGVVLVSGEVGRGLWWERWACWVYVVAALLRRRVAGTKSGACLG